MILFGTAGSDLRSGFYAPADAVRKVFATLADFAGASDLPSTPFAVNFLHTQRIHTP